MSEVKEWSVKEDKEEANVDQAKDGPSDAVAEDSLNEREVTDEKSLKQQMDVKFPQFKSQKLRKALHKEAKKFFKQLDKDDRDRASDTIDSSAPQFKSKSFSIDNMSKVKGRNLNQKLSSTVMLKMPKMKLDQSAQMNKTVKLSYHQKSKTPYTFGVILDSEKVVPILQRAFGDVDKQVKQKVKKPSSAKSKLDNMKQMIQDAKDFEVLKETFDEKLAADQESDQKNAQQEPTSPTKYQHLESLEYMSVDKLNRDSIKKGSPDRLYGDQYLYKFGYDVEKNEKAYDSPRREILPAIMSRSQSVPELTKNNLNFIESWIAKDPDREPFHPSINKIIQVYQHKSKEFEQDKDLKRELYKQAKETLLKCDSVRNFKDVTGTDRFLMNK